MNRWVTAEQQQALAAVVALPGFPTQAQAVPGLAPITTHPHFAPATEQLRRDGVSAFSGVYGAFLSDFAIQLTELAPSILAAGGGAPSFEDIQAQACAAAKAGNLPALHAIFESDTADPVLLFAHDRDGLTALHCAAQGGFSDVVTYLLGKGLDPNIRAANRETALHFAARTDRIDVIRILLDAGAAVDLCNANDRTPLDFFDDNAMAYYLEHVSQEDSMLSSSPVVLRPVPIVVPASPAPPVDFAPSTLEFVATEIHSRVLDELSDCRIRLHHANQRISELEADGECILCFEHRIDSVILECAHAVLCFKCASSSRNCPICKQTATRVVLLRRT